MMFLSAFALAATLQVSPSCLHDRATEKPEQAARRQKALTVARLLGSAEATFASWRDGKYADLTDLIASGALEARAISPSSFSITLDLTEKGFWFAVVDDEDSCGFRYVSNEKGVIFHAEPIR